MQDMPLATTKYHNIAHSKYQASQLQLTLSTTTSTQTAASALSIAAIINLYIILKMYYNKMWGSTHKGIIQRCYFVNQNPITLN